MPNAEAFMYHELAPLIDADRVRIPDPATHPVERSDHILAAITEPRIEHRRSA